MKKRILLSFVILMVALPLIIIGRENSRDVARRVNANAGKAKNIAVLLDKFTVELRRLATDIETTSAGIKDRGNKQQIDALENKIDGLVEKTSFLRQQADELASIAQSMDNDSNILAEDAGQKRTKRRR